MPERRSYRVTQTREVEVTANSTVDAIKIAAAAFTTGQSSDGSLLPGTGPEGVWGNTDKVIKELSLHCERKS